MRRSILLGFLGILLVPLLLSIPSEGVREKGFEDVNIEKFLEFGIDFTDGERLKLEIDLESDPHPVSVFLIKGEFSHQEWIDSEFIDITAIKNGTDVTNVSISFTVVKGFSIQNTTSYTNSISIGDKDTYYLIIALHRDAGMSTDDVLTRATVVSYDIRWTIEEREFDLSLCLAAVAIFVIGTVLVGIALYLGRRNKRHSEMEVDQKSQFNGPETMRTGRKAPPLG
ncbi:MAG: hypothetical protein ACMUIE_01865 [Thermoplasmatota archaeon]